MDARMRRRNQTGFTLIETMISTLVLSIGLLGLVGILAQGLAYMSVSQYEYIAQQKAAEAVESIFTARDQGQLTWSTICNVAQRVQRRHFPHRRSSAVRSEYGRNSRHLGRLHQRRLSGCGAHGLGPSSQRNYRHLYDASRIPLTNFGFTRTITISSVTGISNLRTIQVTIAYRAGRWPSMSYTLTSAISNFS